MQVSSITKEKIKKDNNIKKYESFSFLFNYNLEGLVLIFVKLQKLTDVKIDKSSKHEKLKAIVYELYSFIGKQLSVTV